ncbi:MAG: hypothetical protein JW795_15300 [Chitinivibrionales bacterium]|nr:hypothetical protein [Chitinivibrionales bacterium]
MGTIITASTGINPSMNTPGILALRYMQASHSIILQYPAVTVRSVTITVFGINGKVVYSAVQNSAGKQGCP